jgi:hypothetical protein
MMDQLLIRAENLRPGLQQLLSTPIIDNTVQGAVLELDRYWMEWFIWNLYRRPFDYEDRELTSYWLSRWSLFSPSRFDWDFNKHPPNWGEHCKAMGYPEGSNPLVVRVILNQQTKESGGHQANTDQFPRSFEGYPLIYETRPPLVALNTIERIRRSISDVFAHFGFTGGRQQSNAAISIGRAVPTPTAGTLGGFLRDPVSGKQYIVSCAHVMGDAQTQVYTPGPYENRGMSEVGVVSFAELPPVQLPGQACNLPAMPLAGRLDVAVAELSSDAQLPDTAAAQTNLSTVRLAASMSPFQPVSFTGKMSGAVAAYLGGCTIWHSIRFADGFRCFGSLFEIVAPSGRPRPLARGGDSGAWVVDHTLSAPSWNGMLISAVQDGDRAYCCFAQHILEACRNRFPEGLSFII